MDVFRQLDDAAVAQIRKTYEFNPPRVAVLDVFAAITGLSTGNCSNVWKRLQEEYPELTTGCSRFKFPGRGQTEIDVADARTITEIIFCMKGKVAAAFRKKSASVIVRFLGGDPTLVETIAANRLAQGQLPEEHPMRLFGESVESETLKRRREELEIAELEGRIKRARIQAVVESVSAGMGALKDLGLPIDDRDRMRAKDMINTVTFEARPEMGEKEICVRRFLQERGHNDPSLDARLGRLAKKKLLMDVPDHQFSKKNIYCNGQLIEANVWRVSQIKYLEMALSELLPVPQAG